MLRKNDFAFVTKLLLDEFFHPYPLANPERDGHQERAPARRCIGQVTVQNPVKLQERLLIEGNKVQLASLDAAFAQTILHGVFGENRIMFFAGEAFLLRCGNDLAVAHQAGRAVVVKSGEAQDVHGARADQAGVSGHIRQRAAVATNSGRDAFHSSMCLAAERGVYAASPFGWRARQNIPSLTNVRALKRRKRRAPKVSGAFRTLNTYPQRP